MIGRTLGPYRVIDKLGEGGMGAVYRARDSRLGRDVAIKVLPAPLAGDPERRQRFEREAHAVAALNHPNIVTVHSVETIDGEHLLTMELVDGRPLSAMIPRGGLLPDAFLRIAIQLADAVGAAHARGVTHRDLKPSNVMVTADGRVKVLDFGLATYQAIGGTAESLVTSPALTQAGVILGTVAYMSPEQAEGRAVDERSDIFSLGVTFHEMATGRRPFSGESTVAVMSSILRDAPPSVTELNPAYPPALARVIRRCLQKDPDRRYHSARDLRNDLEEAAETAPHAGAIPEAPRRRRRGLPAALVVGAIALGALVVLGPWRAASDDDGAAAAAEPMSFAQLTWDDGLEAFPSLSPDGRWLVYSGNGAGNDDIYLQGVGGQTAINLTQDSPADDRQPAFSPDGERIVFRSERDGGGLFVMGRTGEATRRVTDVGFNPAWSPDGTAIVVATEDVVLWPHGRGPASALWVVTLATGERREVSRSDAVQPAWSPNGHRIACWTTIGPGRQRDIATIPAAGGDPVPVTDDAALDWNPVWAPDGRHLYFLSNRGGIMAPWRVAIDEDTGRTLAPPEPVTVPAASVAHLTFSADGQVMAFAAVEAASNVDRLDLDPSGLSFAGPATPITDGSRLWEYADESEDGQWLVLGSSGTDENLFIARADGSGLRQLTSDSAFDRWPRWSPDGRRIAFQSNRSGTWEAWAINADGSGLTALTDKLMAHRPQWAPDGARMTFNDFLLEFRVGLVDPRKRAAEQTVERLAPLAGARYWMANDWSPDGNWIAGARPPAGVVVFGFDTGAATLISESGIQPVWMPDSRRIVYNDPAGIAVLDRETRRMQLLLPRSTASILDLSRDGRRLYVSRVTLRADLWLARK